jgi:hypothetical protein
VGLVADQHELTGETTGARTFGGLGTGQAGADDDQRLGSGHERLL